ncbi:Uncharacterised protein [Mycobacteroides abscessus subsp. abscessus]|nr:Uncharacterised protein [Mycobacteroides abscessus subsp. abscessus]
MSGFVEDLQCGAGHRGMREVAMADGNDQVVATPNELNRNGFGQVTSVQHGDYLAAPVHHRAQRAGELARISDERQ